MLNCRIFTILWSFLYNRICICGSELWVYKHLTLSLLCLCTMQEPRVTRPRPRIEVRLAPRSWSPAHAATPVGIKEEGNGLSWVIFYRQKTLAAWVIVEIEGVNSGLKELLRSGYELFRYKKLLQGEGAVTFKWKGRWWQLFLRGERGVGYTHDLFYGRRKDLILRGSWSNKDVQSKWMILYTVVSMPSNLRSH